MNLFLQGQHATVQLVNGESFEYHWRNAGGKGVTVVASYCPDNYPSFSVFTLTNAESVKSVRQLLTEGWEGVNRNAILNH